MYDDEPTRLYMVSVDVELGRVLQGYLLVSFSSKAYLMYDVGRFKTPYRLHVAMCALYSEF
jgi:hypothetical protein